MTIGTRTIKRTKDPIIEKVLDHRTKTILNAVITEPRGRALIAYLKVMHGEK